MKIEKTNLEDCYLLTVDLLGDSRGYFSVPFNREEMQKLGFQNLVQHNQSGSQKGVLRGMHFQAAPDTQAKIVSVEKGAVLDVVVDMRKDSKTYGQYTYALLTGDNHQMLYVPRGFAHGFLALEDNTKFGYYVDNIYSPKKDGGILWSDPDLNIPWEDWCKEYGVDYNQIQLKLADQNRPRLKDCPVSFYKKYRYLVTGVQGQLGYDVVKELNSRGIYDVLAVDKDEMDICDQDRVDEIIRAYAPEVIIHCAAYTNVKKAEEEKEIAKAINVDGTRNLVTSAARVGAKFIYVSTDYVFDGTKKSPYEVGDKANPLNVYGKTKYLGEEVARTYDKSFIVRTSWVFGVNGNNFVKTMINQAQTKDEVQVVSDQIGSPTYTVDLAKLLVDMAQTEKYGTYHAHNEGYCSWYQFTKDIYDTIDAKTKVTPIASDTFPSSVVRPLDSRLSTESLSQNEFDKLPEYKDAVKRYVKELK